MRGMMLVAALSWCSSVRAEQLEQGQKAEVWSAILCIANDAQSQAKAEIKEEYANARRSGGDVVDLSSIKWLQDRMAIARTEADEARKALRALKSRAAKCSDVARLYNCINHLCYDVACEADECDIKQIERFKSDLDGMHSSNVSSTRLYTFKGGN